jgi:hypothetical protein
MAQANFESDTTWMQYITDIEKYLPELTKDLFRGKRLYESCAIVGNSGNLKRAAWGKEIDAHEAIFRFNRVRRMYAYPPSHHVGGIARILIV